MSVTYIYICDPFEFVCVKGFSLHLGPGIFLCLFGGLFGSVCVCSCLFPACGCLLGPMLIAHSIQQNRNKNHSDGLCFQTKLFCRIVGKLYEAHTCPRSHLRRELKIKKSTMNDQNQGYKGAIVIAWNQIQRCLCDLPSPHTSSQTRKKHISSAGVTHRNFSPGCQ